MVMNASWKFYLHIHLIPVLIFKFKLLKKGDKKYIFQQLKHVLKGTLKSCLFLSTYIALFRYGLCVFKNLRHKVDRWNVILAGFLSGFGLLWEPPGRRTELALYFLPRFLEALWGFSKKRQWVTPIKHGEIIIFAIAMGIIMYCY